MRLPKLPEPCTLEEAAEWLGEVSGQKWTARSVLSRFEDWEHEGTTSRRAFAPETLYVVIPTGTELLDATNEFQPISFVSPMRFSVTTPVDAFIHELLMAGEATPPGLTSGIGKRYRATTSVPIAAVQIPRDWVKQLFSSFDALALELSQQPSEALQELDDVLDETNEPASLLFSSSTNDETGELATTGEVRTAFAQATGDSYDKFVRALGDAHDWIKLSRRDPAGKGRSAGYLWSVAVLAEAITKHYSLNRKSVHAAIAGKWPVAAELYGL